MSDDTPESLIPYDEIVQEALRDVVGRVLSEVEGAGGHLPGGHHFYITFQTRMPGVTIPKHLSDRFPDEMTIVLQHQFWGLEVGDNAFSVTLSFANQLERLTVPFASVTGFADPAVKFGLQFEGRDGGAARVPSVPAASKAASAGRETGSSGNAAPPAPKQPGSADVVTLDSFRKKS